MNGRRKINLKRPHYWDDYNSPSSYYDDYEDDYDSTSSYQEVGQYQPILSNANAIGDPDYGQPGINNFGKF